MTDTVSSKTRSRIMAAVPHQNTSAELKVRSALHKAGKRFRLHRKDLPGTPDLVFPSKKIVVFVHGCFWHSHGCKKSRPPSSNREYWMPKMKENRQRDEKKIAQLESLGWRSVIIWECEIDTGVARLLEELSRGSLR